MNILDQVRAEIAKLPIDRSQKYTKSGWPIRRNTSGFTEARWPSQQPNDLPAAKFHPRDHDLEIL